MSIIVANGLLITEATYLYADLIADNPVIPMNVAVFTYDSINGNGAFVNLKGYIGSDVTFDKCLPIFYGPPSKIPKAFTGSDMASDSIFQYILTTGDISILGQTIELTGLLINNENCTAIYKFSNSQGSLNAGDTIDFLGLPLKVNVSSITFNLS